MTAEWMLVGRPCKDCRITFVALKEACKHCEAIIRWHIESEAQRKLLEYLIVVAKDTPTTDTRWIPLHELELMLKQLEEKQ